MNTTTKPIAKRETGKLASTTITNEIVDALNNDLPSIGQVDDHHSPIEDSVKISVYNDTGGTLNKFDAVVLIAPSYNPDPPNSDDDQSDDDKEFKNRVLVSCDVVASNTAGFPWGVVSESIEDQTVGACVVLGVVQCNIDVKAVGDRYVDLDAASSNKTYPSSGSAGPAQIVWVDGWETTPGTATNTGVQWAVIRIGGSPPNSDYGTLKGQIKLMLTDNQAGWGWEFFVSIPTS